MMPLFSPLHNLLKYSVYLRSRRVDEHYASLRLNCTVLYIALSIVLISVNKYDDDDLCTRATEAAVHFIMAAAGRTDAQVVSLFGYHRNRKPVR